MYSRIDIIPGLNHFNLVYTGPKARTQGRVHGARLPRPHWSYFAIDIHLAWL